MCCMELSRLRKRSWNCSLTCQKKNPTQRKMTIYHSFHSDPSLNQQLVISTTAQFVLHSSVVVGCGCFILRQAIRSSVAEWDWMIHFCLSHIQYIILNVGSVTEEMWWTHFDGQHVSVNPPSSATICHRLMEQRKYRQFWHIAHLCTSLCWNRHIKANPAIVSPKPWKSRGMDQPTECAHSMATIEKYK